jgi:hypothetical protein
MAEVKTEIILAALISDQIKMSLFVKPSLDTSGYAFHSFTGNTVTLFNDKGSKVVIEAQFVIKEVKKNEI